MHPRVPERPSLILRAGLRATELLDGWRIARQAVDPMGVQRALLARIIRRQRDTEFGRRYGFSLIDDYAAFARRVPVTDGARLRSLSGEDAGQSEASSAEQDVRPARTQPKGILRERGHEQSLRRIQRTVMAFRHRARPQAFAGAILVVPGAGAGRAGVDAHSAASMPHPISSWDGLPGYVRSRLVVPSAVLAMEPAPLRDLLVLRLALGRADVTCIEADDPRALLNLTASFAAHSAALLGDVSRGTFFARDQVSPDVWHAVAAELYADPRRAEAIASALGEPANARIARLWPDLAMVATCAHPGCPEMLAVLRREMGPGPLLFDTGVVAGGVQGAVTLGRRPGTAFPTLDTHFFEFVERDCWDSGDARFLTIDQVSKGPDYYVLVTTSGGLHRYFTDTLVRVSGRLHRTPLLRVVAGGRDAIG